MGSECFRVGLLISSGVFLSNFSVDLWGWVGAGTNFREEVDLPDVEIGQSACPGWSVISEVASKIDHFATVLCAFNFRENSPTNVVLQQAPRAVGPPPIRVHLGNNWLRSSWDASAQWQRCFASVQIDIEGPDVDWCEIEVDAEVEPVKGHLEPWIEVCVKLHVGVELKNFVSGLWKLVFITDAPVQAALDIPCIAGLPISNKGDPRDWVFACIDVFVWPVLNVIERK